MLEALVGRVYRTGNARALRSRRTAVVARRTESGVEQLARRVNRGCVENRDEAKANLPVRDGDEGKLIPSRDLNIGNGAAPQVSRRGFASYRRRGSASSLATSGGAERLPLERSSRVAVCRRPSAVAEVRVVTDVNQTLVVRGKRPVREAVGKRRYLLNYTG